MTNDPEARRRLFRVDYDYAEYLPIFPSIFPGQDTPVVRLGEDAACELVTMTGSAEDALALAKPYPSAMMAIVARGETRDEPPMAAE